MRFYTAFLAGALAAIAAAQNPFTITTIPTSISAGTSFNITWQPTSSGTVSLLLVQANSPGSMNVHTVSTIGSKLPNSGAFNWLVAQSIPKGSGYALEIVSDDNSNIINYSGQFAIDSSTSPSASGSASGASASASGPSSTVAVTSSGASSSPSAAASPSNFGNSTVTFTSTSPTTLVGTTIVGATTTATSTSKNAGAVETARAGVGLLAFLGAAVLAL